MADTDRRSAGELSGRMERELERLEREREALERERDKLEHEREKLERVREEMEARFERQEERLEQIEDELEAREEELEEAEEELADLEVEGVEGIREVLDVVSDRIPRLMKGIQQSVYSPEQLQGTAEAFASFYKTLLDAGMPDSTAAEFTRRHFESLERQMESHLGAHGAKRSRHAPGPDFDPLGPNFDPFHPARRGRKPASAAEPAAPAEPSDPAEPADERAE